MKVGMKGEHISYGQKRECGSGTIAPPPSDTDPGHTGKLKGKRRHIPPEDPTKKGKIPVIFDTDIGGDIGDTWALAQLLSSDKLDPLMIVVSTGDLEYRAKIVAKFLEVTGRTDIPVAFGVETDWHRDHCQGEWIKGFDLKRTPVRLIRDGIREIANCVLSCADPVTFVCASPLTTIASLVKRHPGIVPKSGICATLGSLYSGYDGKEKPDPERNAVADTEACQTVLSAEWPISMATLDASSRLIMKDDDFLRVIKSESIIARALIQNVDIWSSHTRDSALAEGRSTPLFDCLAVYLAEREDLVEVRNESIRVNEKGYTRPDPKGIPVRAALGWKNQPEWLKQLSKQIADEK